MTRRDVRIDFIRGMGILMIAVDHFGGLAALLAPQPFVLPFVTWTRLGWSSAAEFFVFYSGYLVGSVFMLTLANKGFGLLQARCIHRAWQIYAANLLTCGAAILLLYLPPFGDAHLAGVAGIDALVSGETGAGILAFLTLQSAPMFFEILHMYMAFLVFAGALLVLVRASPVAAVLASGALWLLVQRHSGFNPGGWHFNPWAWQFVFVLGIVFSRSDPIGKLTARFGRRRLLWFTGLALAAALAVKALDKSGWSLPLIGTLEVPGIDKSSLGPLRLAHFLISIVFISLALPSPQRLAQFPAVETIARIGRHSLECFCLSTLFVYAAAAFLAGAQALGSVGVLCAGALITVLLCASARGLEWLKAKPWAGASPGAAIRMSSAPPEGSASLAKERSV